MTPPAPPRDPTISKIIFKFVFGVYSHFLVLKITKLHPLRFIPSLVFTSGTKHEKACSDNQQVLIPFTFDIFDFLAPETVNPSHRVKRVTCLLGL